MAKPGRKGFGEEFNLKKRYAELSEPFFAVLKEMLESDDKNDKKWAVEQLGKAYPKMIPQEVDNKHQGEITIKWQTDGNNNTVPTEGATITST